MSWVVYHVAFDPAWADRLPYHVAVIELDEGPRLITNLVDVVPGTLSIDARVELVIGHEGDEPVARCRVVGPMPSSRAP